jgi:hypothetical protein
MHQPMPIAALDVRGLCKRFDRPAVDGLDLTIRKGAVVGSIPAVTTMISMAWLN